MCCAAVRSSSRARSCGSSRPARTTRWTSCCGAPGTRPGSRAPPAGTPGSPTQHGPSPSTRVEIADFLAVAADDLAVLFDKRLSHGLLDAADVPVPYSPTSGPQAPPVRGWDDVRAALGTGGMHRAFIKLAHGSSASGVLAVEYAGPGRIRATTSVERAEDGSLFNSLRVRRYDTERDIAAILDTLAPDGLHIERWLPKASQDKRAADLRVVVIGGRATHAVVRTSRSPMTNLHLGGVRGDLAAARAAAEAAGVAWSTVLGTAERAAACFPDTLCVGVDLLPGTGWRQFAVGEVNAFGDLLPRLTGLPGSGAEGQDTYAAQIAAVVRAHGEDHQDV
ncbi:conserved hypothetical protein [Streptomyces himastatinicus ATCC 53653]|uniref:Uncharacterized protein n=1 Tax=Streptomyces himastatinicus ATCC 53653 TaxID=457427 RepID=D9WS94_9ACTN|nr:conserved hypothetical protein [Streptomyces himastatinicus ATCC 53653]